MIILDRPSLKLALEFAHVYKSALVLSVQSNRFPEDTLLPNTELSVKTVAHPEISSEGIQVLGMVTLCKASLNK